MHSSFELPVCPLPWLDDAPEAVFARVEDRRGAVWLDSALASGESVSVIGFDPVEEVVADVGNLGRVRSWLRERRPPGGQAPGSFCGGAAIGYVTYEGEAVFGLYPKLLVFRHGTGEWSDVGGLARELPAALPVLGPEPGEPLRLEAEMTPAGYERRVRRALDYIAAGDIYQVNLAQRFSAPWPEGESGFGLYRCLRSASPAPHAAFLRLGGLQILSSSPELFLRLQEDAVLTRPIKGTRPRHLDPVRDARSAAELVASAKETAELVMITDLLRNDLGRISRYGSIDVPELARLERFPQVFHLVSTVRGTLRPGIDHVEALAACFPGGSITGAPKIRAMEIIAELETGPRGPYTGAIGYFGADGHSQFNIAIRTAVIEGGRLEFRVGAGIVADSDPAAEQEETQHKAAGFRAALDVWEKREDSFARSEETATVGVPDGFRPEVLRLP